MYAIVEIGGQQFQVEKNQEIFVNKLEGNEGDKKEIEKVLLINDGKSLSIGNPTVKNSKVVVSILEQVKGNKVIVFKKKKRKGYQKQNGHRQQYTKIKIESINTKK